MKYTSQTIADGREAQKAVFLSSEPQMKQAVMRENELKGTNGSLFLSLLESGDEDSKMDVVELSSGKL